MRRINWWAMGLVAAVPGWGQWAKPSWCDEPPRPEYKTMRRIALSDSWLEVYLRLPPKESWFQVYRPRPGVYAIYEPYQAEKTISYLILGKERAILFDSGMGIGDLRRVVEELTSLPVIVLNSHTHNDHVGGNWQFENVWGMDTDFTRANAVGSSKDAQAEIAPGESCGSFPAGFDRRAYATKPWKISRYVHDGDKIDLGGRTIEVMATPGHTPDSMCLFDAERGQLFTGDTFYPGTIWLYRPETDLVAYGASIRRLASLGTQVKVVMGAHNVPSVDGEVLGRLVQAFEDSEAGKVEGTAAGEGKVVFKVGGIGFLEKKHL